jgi:hypothetical protein
MDDSKETRLNLAREAAKALLDDIESGTVQIAVLLMRAKRLARLLRDQDAQRWLDLELKGYPQNFKFESIGTCKRYAMEGGRITEDGKYYLKSLPGIEASFKASEATLSAMKLPSIDKPVQNFLEANATLHVFNTSRQHMSATQQSFTSWSELFSSMKSSLHSYAADSSIALELGDYAEGIFEEARNAIDTFVRSHCPEAAQQLVAINERMRDGDKESLSAALNSCRRLLSTVADTLFPATDQDFTDSHGKKRKVGKEEYKNRLICFLDKNISSKGDSALLQSEVEHLAARLDAIYEKTCKGVHDGVSPEEARLAVISTFLFLGELARHTTSKADVGANNSLKPTPPRSGGAA